MSKFMKKISESDDVQLPGSTDTAASFEFEREDHTLGNALRWIIMKKYARITVTKLFPTTV